MVALVALTIAGLSAGIRGCGPRDSRRVITVWHPMRQTERDVLYEEFARFEKLHPELRVRGLYKETEELRSGFQAAALAGEGPELVYGPSDVLDTFHTMGLLADMAPWYTDVERADFISGALTYLPALVDPTKHELVQVADRFGNHLSLIYNRKFIKTPPQTTDELIALARANTLDVDGDGRKDRYGLVWSFVEPYFAIPFLTGHGAWVFAEPSSGPTGTRPVPALDTPQSVAAYQFIQDLHDKYRVVPGNCDYELADSLFKSGRAAMIINGDWSWTDYLTSPELDAAVAVLPIVSSTGLPMKSMIMPKGYSLNANASPEAAAAAMMFVKYMTSPDVQQRIVDRLRMIPTRQSVYDKSLSSTDPTYRVSQAQVARTRLIPVATELRAVWDAMRPQYQAVLSNATEPATAAATMQRDALEKIHQMRQDPKPTISGIALQTIGLLLLAGWILWQRDAFLRFAADWRRNPIAYLFVLPAAVLIFAVIIFPLGYNVVLSMSNMSLTNFRDWRIVGLQNYQEVVTDPQLAPVLFKTLVWTIVSVSFHLAIGVLLALALHHTLRGRAVYQLLLILPWAIPAYITALTWRGMFSYDYGAVNLILLKLQRFPPLAWLLEMFHLAAPVNWLGDATHAFEACIAANVWLGFPFMMVVALGGLQGISAELYDAARIDRASRWQQFRYITLPLLSPVLIPAATLATLWTFNNLNVIWLVSNGGQPQNSTHILVSYVYMAVFNLYRYGYGAALSMVMFLLLLAFALIFLHRTRASENIYG
jgi:arabinogalactan oligomer / maltooligosaccharide transport system substrate-binding protein/arabinogalactan oligomer / maltooligosaccharide transport system permease protein